MRFGKEKKEKVECRKRRRYQELEVNSEESMAALHRIFLDRPVLRAFLATEVRRVMKHIMDKYSLPELPELFLHLDHQIQNAEQGRGANALPRVAHD